MGLYEVQSINEAGMYCWGRGNVFWLKSAIFRISSPLAAAWQPLYRSLLIHQAHFTSQNMEVARPPQHRTETHLTSKPLNYSFRTQIPGGGEGTTTDIEGQPIGVCAVLIGCNLGFILRVCDVKKKRDDDSSIDCFRHFIRQKCQKSLLNIKICSFSLYKLLTD